jgi:hypothetical protein
MSDAARKKQVGEEELSSVGHLDRGLLPIPAATVQHEWFRQHFKPATSVNTETLTTFRLFRPHVKNTRCTRGRHQQRRSFANFDTRFKAIPREDSRGWIHHLDQ